MLRAEVGTLADWLRESEAAIAAAGYESPRKDAELLAAHGLGLRWGDLWLRTRDPIGSEARTRLDDLLARRCSGEPMAYITGSVVFHGLELVSGRAGPVVADIGTGTGAIAIAIGARRPDAWIWATDVSQTALSYAERNAARCGVALSLASGDLFDALPGSLRGRVDLVVSNPPYVPQAADLPDDVRAEPPEALRAGDKGDEVLRRLVALVPSWIGDDGALAVEVGTADQAAGVLAELGGFRETGIRVDDNGRERVVWATS